MIQNIRSMLCAAIIVSGFAVPASANKRIDDTFDSSGVSIRYTIEGRGEPVLLVHGFRASGDLNWRLPGVNKILAEHFRVITIDHRGHGKSGIPADHRYGVAMVGDVIGLMDHLGLESAHMVGYSMGGMIVNKLTAMHPHRVRSAVIGGMGWYEPDANASEEGEPADHYERVARGFRELAMSENEMKSMDVPIVVLIGTEDYLLRRVERWQSIEPDLNVVYIEGANHNGCIFKPEFKSGILDFLKAQPVGQ
jgi:hypothetical protein